MSLEENGSITNPADVTRLHMREYMAVQESVRRGSGVLTCYADCRVFWRWFAGEYGDCDECADPAACKFHSCSKSPMHGVRRPSPRKHKAKVVPVLTPEQPGLVLASVPGRAFRACRDRALIMLLVESGVRRTEAHALDVSDLNLTRRGGGTVHVRDGKNHSDRHSVVGPDAALALDRLLDRHPLNPHDGGEWDGPWNGP